MIKDEEQLRELGYISGRQLPNGEWLAIQKMLSTTGLFIVPDEYTWVKRFCYEHFVDAVFAMLTWNGIGDPPGLWLKEKPSDRLGPGIFRDKKGEQLYGR